MAEYSSSDFELAQALVAKLREYDSNGPAASHYSYYLDSPDGVQALATALSEVTSAEVVDAQSRRYGQGV